MASTNRSLAALQQTLEALSRAQSSTRIADARAQRVQATAAHAGFRAIAAKMNQVATRLRRVQVAQSELADLSRAALTTVQMVPIGGSPAEVVAALTPVVTQLLAASTNTSHLAGEIEAAKADVTSALKGGKPEPMLAALDQIKRAQIQVAGALTDAERHVAEALAQARDSGNFSLGVAPAQTRHPRTLTRAGRPRPPGRTSIASSAPARWHARLPIWRSGLAARVVPRSPWSPAPGGST